MNLVRAIQHLHPTVQQPKDFLVQDDGHGPRLVMWNAVTLIASKPTDAELQAAWLACVIEDKVKELDSKCNAAILSGFNSSALGVEHSYGFGFEDQTNLTGTLSMFNADPLMVDVTWKTMDAGPLLHDRDQFLALCRDGMGHKNNLIARYWALKTQVEAATTAAEVEAITWETTPNT